MTTLIGYSNSRSFIVSDLKNCATWLQLDRCKKKKKKRGKKKETLVIDTDRFVDVATQVDPSQDTQ